MSDDHRNTLEAILSLLNDIITHEHLNKMTVHNIATIIAPNLFPNLVDKKLAKTNQHHQMTFILDRAQHSFVLTKMLITYQLVLFHVIILFYYFLFSIFLLLLLLFLVISEI